MRRLSRLSGPPGRVLAGGEGEIENAQDRRAGAEAASVGELTFAEARPHGRPECTDTALDAVLSAGAPIFSRTDRDELSGHDLGDIARFAAVLLAPPAVELYRSPASATVGDV
jgi:hypothetical protein